jgi:hypothetical protein
VLKVANQAIEERMMSEYIGRFLRGANTQIHVRLGMPPGIKIGDPDWQYKRQLMMPMLLEADLLYFQGPVLWILEFKVRRFQEAIGKLLQYKLLIPETPGYQNVKPDNIKLKIVFGRPDPIAANLAKTLGIETEQYEPDWLKQMIAARSGGPI